VEDKTMQKVSIETDKTVIRDRIRGAILGAACANSLGGSCIGVNYKDIITSAAISGLRDYVPGLSKSLRPDHKPGEVLADAFLALSLADSLIAGGGKYNADDVKKRFSALLENDEFLKSSPGAVVLAELRRMADNLELLEGDPEGLHANAAARAIPAGCLPGAPKSDEGSDVAAKQAALTHGDKRSMSASAVVADSIYFFINGNKLTNENEVRAYVKREFEVANRYDPRFAESWDDVAPDLNYIDPAEDLPYSLINVESNVNELVPTAVGIFLIFRHSLEEAVCAAARSGGDTDTVSAIVGALSGAYHGASKIPERWLSNLSHKEDFERIAEALAKFWS
jgi:ADP-ribosylglycohydrolase